MLNDGSRGIQIRTLAYHVAAIFLGLISFPTVEAQPQQVSPGSVPSEENQLLERLKLASEAMLRFDNVEDTPLKITQATIRAVRREKSAVSSPKLRGDYVFHETVTGANVADRTITRVTLQFINFSDRQENVHTIDVTIKPKSSTAFPRPPDGTPDLITSFTAPRELVVRVSELRFEDGSIWEMNADLPEQPEIDDRPMLLNKPKPAYSEEAKKNRIEGSVRLALLVDEDGKVKRVKVRRGLPDFLTEEAVVAASGLKFKPALKGGKPIEYWILFEIDFKLPVKRD